MYDEDVDKYISMHKAGLPIRYNQYISTTTDLMYNEDGQVQMHISSQYGKDIRQYNGNENEILFERDAVFMVKKILEKDGIWDIWLEEKKHGK